MYVKNKTKMFYSKCERVKQKCKSSGIDWTQIKLHGLYWKDKLVLKLEKEKKRKRDKEKQSKRKKRKRERQ